MPFLQTFCCFDYFYRYKGEPNTMPGQMERLVIDTTNDAKNNSGPMRKLNLDIGKGYMKSGEVDNDGGGIVNKGHTCEKDNLSDSGFEINDVSIFIVVWNKVYKKLYIWMIFCLQDCSDVTKTPRLHGGDGVPTLTLDKNSVSSFGGKSTQSNNPCKYRPSKAFVLKFHINFPLVIFLNLLETGKI